MMHYARSINTLHVKTSYVGGIDTIAVSYIHIVRVYYVIDLFYLLMHVSRE